jgi:hypothetical protein
MMNYSNIIPSKDLRIWGLITCYNLISTLYFNIDVNSGLSLFTALTLWIIGLLSSEIFKENKNINSNPFVASLIALNEIYVVFAATTTVFGKL